MSAWDEVFGDIFGGISESVADIEVTTAGERSASVQEIDGSSGENVSVVRFVLRVGEKEWPVYRVDGVWRSKDGMRVSEGLASRLTEHVHVANARAAIASAWGAEEEA